MTGAAIALVLVSALLHAAWNFFNKGSADRWAFFVAQGVLTCVCYAPLVVWAWPHDGIDRMGWVWIIASAVTHAAYAVFLLKSYDAGDLSVAYPLSRTAPVLVAAWDIATARGQLTVGGVGGAVLAGIGALTLQLPALARTWRARRARRQGHALRVDDRRLHRGVHRCRQAGRHARSGLRLLVPALRRRVLPDLGEPRAVGGRSRAYTSCASTRAPCCSRDSLAPSPIC